MVVTSVPLSVPTGPGDDERDGWADFNGNTGYEREVTRVGSVSYTHLTLPTICSV